MKKYFISTASLGSIFNSLSKTFSDAVTTIISFSYYSVMKCNILNIKIRCQASARQKPLTDTG